MGKAHTNGKMVVATKDSISMIKNMDSGYTHGRMEENTKGIGKMAKDKVEADMCCRRDRVDREYGIKIKG